MSFFHPCELPSSFLCLSPPRCPHTRCARPTPTDCTPMTSTPGFPLLLRPAYWAAEFCVCLSRWCLPAASGADLCLLPGAERPQRRPRLHRRHRLGVVAVDDMYLRPWSRYASILLGCSSVRLPCTCFVSFSGLLSFRHDAAAARRPALPWLLRSRAHNHRFAAPSPLFLRPRTACASYSLLGDPDCFNYVRRSRVCGVVARVGVVVVLAYAPRRSVYEILLTLTLTLLFLQGWPCCGCMRLGR